jgi:hypothetical protein
VDAKVLKRSLPQHLEQILLAHATLPSSADHRRSS